MAGVLTAPGCTHNHYYGYNPCAPAPTAVVPGAVSYGGVCEVPTNVSGGTAIASGSSVVTAPAIVGARPPRVVVSEPNGGSRFAWRRSDPESGRVTTRVEGATDDPTLTR